MFRFKGISQLLQERYGVITSKHEGQRQCHSTTGRLSCHYPDGIPCSVLLSGLQRLSGTFVQIRGLHWSAFGWTFS